MSEQPDFDLVIVGGGMVGATLACALADSPLRIALVEARAPAPGWSADRFDLRVSAVTRASEAILRHVGAWEGIAGRRLAPFDDMRVWDARGGRIHFDSAAVGETTLGYIIENSAIQDALDERLAAADNVERRAPVQCSELILEAQQARLVLAEGGELRTRLVVGADGANSWVREQAGIECRGWSYEQQGVVATVKPARHHQDTAWQRFLPGGPLAFLPLPDGYCSIVWSTDTPNRLLEMDDAAFKKALGEAFDHTLGTIEWVSPRAAFPLRLQHAVDYTRPRLALIGDAAHTIHPLAGQGVNLGFLDAAALAELLIDQAKARGDLGSHKLLRRYERWRKTDNVAMMTAMDGFQRLFGQAPLPIRLLRNAGLSLADHSGPLKQRIIKHAMGLRGDLPRMARGGQVRSSKSERRTSVSLRDA